MAELRLTYEELAARLNLRPEAARQRAKRRQREGRWRIVLANDGRAIVHLDEADLAAELARRRADDRPKRSEERPPERPADDRGELVAELRARVRGLEATLERERRAFYEAGDALAAENADLRERVGRAEGEAAALRDALADLAGRLDRAEARLARPWWRRLLG